MHFCYEERLRNFNAAYEEKGKFHAEKCIKHQQKSVSEILTQPP